MTARSGRSSEQIARDVAATLSQKVPGGRDGIEIDAQDGVVTLSGTVPSYKVRCAAEEPQLREAVLGHQVACHFFEALSQPAVVARAGMTNGKFAARLAAFELAHEKRKSGGL